VPGRFRGQDPGVINAFMAKGDEMGIRELAEGIMLQSIEDIWSVKHRKGGLDFFHGEGFPDCADLAGMTLYDRARVINFVHGVAEHASHHVPIAVLREQVKLQSLPVSGNGNAIKEVMGGHAKRR